MTQNPCLAFCQFRNTDVDLRQGFHHCIENNQCFSDGFVAQAEFFWVNRVMK